MLSAAAFAALLLLCCCFAAAFLTAFADAFAAAFAAVSAAFASLLLLLPLCWSFSVFGCLRCCAGAFAALLLFFVAFAAVLWLLLLCCCFCCFSCCFCRWTRASRRIHFGGSFQEARTHHEIMRGVFASAIRSACEEIVAGHEAVDLPRSERAWKLLLLLPRMSLSKPRRGGFVLRKELETRLALFSASEWHILVRQSVQSCEEASRSSNLKKSSDAT